MYEQIVDKYIITDNFNRNELKSFLKKTWGNSSQLSHIEGIDKSQYCVINNVDNEIIGCCGIKFINKNTIELGSLAIGQKYRGNGLAKELFKWRELVLKEYINKGFQLITFATLGSSVMNFIVSKMKQLTTMPVYVLNFTWGIVPIEKGYAIENIPSHKLLHKDKSGYYTSTVSILATNNKSQYEEISLIKNLNVTNHLPTTLKTKVKFKSEKNLYINLEPFRFIIWNIFDEKTTVFPTIDKNKYYQIKVPVLKKFQNTHDYFRKLSITGFSIEKNTLFINYSNITQNKLKNILNNIQHTNTDNSIKMWIELILRINQNL